MRRNAAKILAVAAVLLSGGAWYLGSRVWPSASGPQEPEMVSPTSVNAPRAETPAPGRAPAGDASAETSHRHDIAKDDPAPRPSQSETDASEHAISGKRSSSAKPTNLIPASNAIANWLAEPGDPVMGNPLAAPHQILQREQPDEQWSVAAMQALRDYLGDNFGAKMEFPMIDCRTDICEIQAATLAANENENAMRFQQTVHEMPQMDWWQSLGFGQPTFAIKGLPDGRELIIVFITRKT